MSAASSRFCTHDARRPDICILGYFCLHLQAESHVSTLPDTQVCRHLRSMATTSATARSLFLASPGILSFRLCITQVAQALHSQHRWLRLRTAEYRCLKGAALGCGSRWLNRRCTAHVRGALMWTSAALQVEACAAKEL